MFRIKLPLLHCASNEPWRCLCHYREWLIFEEFLILYCKSHVPKTGPEIHLRLPLQIWASCSTGFLDTPMRNFTAEDSDKEACGVHLWWKWWQRQPESGTQWWRVFFCCLIWVVRAMGSALAAGARASAGEHCGPVPHCDTSKPTFLAIPERLEYANTLQQIPFQL